MIKNQYPVHLLRYPAQLVYDSATCFLILGDEYLFATYFSALLQGAQVDEDNSQGVLNVLQEALKGRGFNEASVDLNRLKLDDQERMMKIVENLKAQFSEQVTTTYVRDFFTSIAVYRAIIGRKHDVATSKELAKNVVKALLEYYDRKAIGISSITQNLDRLAKVMGLTDSEYRLTEMSLLFTIDVRFMIFKDFLFALVKNPGMYDHCYRTMLRQGREDVALEGEIATALSEASKPLALGIVGYDQNQKKLGRMSEFWIYAISNHAETDDKYFVRFLEPLDEKKKSFAGALAKVSERDEGLLQEYFQVVTDDVATLAEKRRRVERKLHALSGQEGAHEGEESGLNVLIYGSPKLDKLGYIATFLRGEGIKGFQVRSKEVKDHDLPSICYVAQQLMAKNHPGDVLIVNKAESALSKRFNRPSWFIDVYGDDAFDRPAKKEQLDSDELLLLKNPVPTIWVASSPGRIDAENVGRFLFHCEMKGGSRKDRREEVQKIIKDLGFSDQTVQTLSRYVELSPEQIKSAARTVELIEQTGEVAESSFLHVISNSQRALSRERMEDIRDSVTKYSLGLLNIKGDVPIARIVEALKRKRQGTLCFYGLPGSGKTQLVEHIAMELDMPLLMKPASELLSMWLGETEKKIAEFFEEARSEGALAFLDEGDSFLRDRALAQRSWEVTQVNELLQKMERYPGIFILATNLFEGLDAAALRRFTFKLEFLALKQEQKIQMMCNEMNTKFEDFSETDQKRIEIDLGTLKYLTPGDFATVKRQANLMDETLTLVDWINRLEIEQRAKLVGLARNSQYAESRAGFQGVTTKKPHE